MPRFEVLAGPTLIGYFDLELGDAAMGSAAGMLSPLPAHFAIQADIIAAREDSQVHLSLVVRPIGGQALPARGGVQILDYSQELGGEGIEVHVLGVG